MRILLLADIHGNRAALEAIREPHDVCLCLGDLVDYGPEPGPCVEWVRRHALATVRGNHDHGVAQNVEVQGVGGFRFLTAITRPPTVAALTAEQRRFLADLPTSCMLTLDGKRFLLVHASPRDPMDEYAPPEPSFWAPRLAGLAVDFVCAGHTHQPYVLNVNGITVINPGSVGLSRDGDPRASYALIENGQVQLKRAEYPIDRTIQAVLTSGLDATAKRMLSDLYRGGVNVARWLKNGSNGNGHANGNGNGNGARG
ncbi:MAG TPA: metallophosphoesterase family protein [Gemmataceae bacterium]|nr:metallophosphoesterase family protein [Gemmataceae bacterium]